MVGAVSPPRWRCARYFGNSPQFWLELQSWYDLSVVEGERGEQIARRVNRPTQPERSSREDWQATILGRVAGGPIAAPRPRAWADVLPAGWTIFLISARLPLPGPWAGASATTPPAPPTSKESRHVE
jgi:hypothetical protein